MIRVPLALVALMLTLLAVSCGWPSSRGGSVGDGGTLRVALPADVVTLDPVLYTDVYFDHVAAQIHETLFTVDHDLRIVPLLAERLEQPDDATYLITLRKGVRFHNGDELTAEDVVFSLNRVTDPATRSPRAGRLSEPLGKNGRIEAVAPHTVRITLSAPYAPFLERLSSPYSSILSKRAVQEAGAEYTQRPVGTGPFTFVERVAAESITVERNADYWGERARVARIIFRTLPDNATRIASLESGEVDHVMSLPAEEVARLGADARFVAQIQPAVGFNFLGFNMSRGPLADPLLRQAIGYAVDREEIVRTIYAGTGQAATAPLDPASWAFEPNVEPYAPDPARARELLARSSYRGEELELAVNNATEARRTAERIQGVLKETLGLPVRVNVMEWGAYLDYLKGGDRHQMYIIGWSGGADPDGTLFPLFSSKNHGAAGNRAWYKNERVDGLLNRAQVTIDQQARTELYREAQRQIMEDLPVVPLRYGINSVATAAKVTGFRLHPLNRANYTTVTINN